jgi:nucleoside-diphosphate-sugar epimerase
MTIFIFGAGPIGLNLKDHYVKSGYEVFVFSSTQPHANELYPSPGMFLRYGEIKKLKQPNSNDSCVVTTRIEKLEMPLRKKMVEDLKFLDSHNVRILNISSVSVYGNSCTRVTENLDPNPTNNYGIEKLEAEKILSKALSPDTFVNLRVANLYGLPGFNDLTNIAIDKLRKQEVILLPRKPCHRDFVSISDLYELLLSWSSGKVQLIGAVNFSTGNSVLLHEWIKILASILSRPVNTSFELEENFQDSFIANEKLMKVWTYTFSDSSSQLSKYLSQIA